MCETLPRENELLINIYKKESSFNILIDHVDNFNIFSKSPFLSDFIKLSIMHILKKRKKEHEQILCANNTKRCTRQSNAEASAKQPKRVNSDM